MSDNRPIAVFDSGLGGLTVVHELIEKMPHENIIYFGDTLRCPYGGRSADAIRQFAEQIALFLVSENAKMLIAACNTISAVALSVVRAIAGDSIPVIGVVEPGCQAAVNHSADKSVGVIGTRGTVASKAYSQGIHKRDASIQVYEKACPLLAPMVEEGVTKGPVLDLLLEEYLNDLVDLGIDTLVLGCTHYPLLKNAIHAVLGGRIEVLDSAWYTAKAAEVALKECGFSSDKNGRGKTRFYVTDMTSQFSKLVEPFLHERAEIKKVNLQKELDRLLN